MNVVAARIDPKTAMFRRDFGDNAADLPGAGLPWLDARRLAAMEAFSKVGVPGRRVEAWKYTDLVGALSPDLEPATHFRGTTKFADPFAGIEAPRLVLADGFLIGVPALDNVEVVNLGALEANPPDWVKEYLGKDASGADQPLGAAALALMRGGVAIRVAGTKPANLHLVFVSPPRPHAVVSHARVLIVVDQGASLTLLESHLGGGRDQTLANLGVELVLRPHARLDHVRLQNEPQATLNVTSLSAMVTEGAVYRALYVALGNNLSRLDVRVQLQAPNAEAHLHGVIALGAGHADITTVVEHMAAHTLSRQVFKSVLGGHARAVMQGRVHVHEGAAKSDSHQLFKALLLSTRAEADAKPELEIFADDVVCGHGTAIGALDPDSLFYLRARGIPQEEAKRMLVRAFLEDAMEGFAPAPVHDAIWRRLDAMLPTIKEEAA
jgi:Fe-S cluster assembly protein SufD